MAEHLTLEQLNAALKRAHWRHEQRQDKTSAASIKALETRIKNVKANA